MKLSIITVVLNDVDHIEKTILSIIGQPYSELEYIVIDGGSTDGTLDIIKKYEKHISYYVSEKDNGIADAFNKGINNATGEVIGLINSGDFLEKNCLQRIAQEINDSDILYGNIQYYDGTKKGYIFKAEHKYLESFMSLNHPAVFVKKNIYEIYGGFDEAYKYAMDYELMLRFYKKGVRFKYLDKVLSNMALGGLSDIHWQAAYREAYEVRKKYLGESVFLYISYLFQVLKRHLSNLISNLGLENVKEFYREYFSVIKKER